MIVYTKRGCVGAEAASSARARDLGLRGEAARPARAPSRPAGPATRDRAAAPAAGGAA